MQYSFKKSWFVFAPFLLIYLFIITVVNNNVLVGDEPRYIQFAQNILNGFYSPRDVVNLWNGPGYPVFIAPFLKMGFSTLGLKLINGFLQYASVVFLYQTLMLWVSPKKAMLLTIFWGCYYIAFKEMTYVYTESLASLLVCVIIYYTSKAFLNNNNSVKGVIVPGILLGVLVLTKVIFGYVIIALFILMFVLYLFTRQNNYVKASWLVGIAFIINLPYLLYTYQLTHKVLYWSNAGGMSLYWASTPVPTEYGDWNDDHFRAYCDYDTSIPCNAQLFAQHHQADYNEIYKYTGVARDSAFKAKAIENIKTHPTKYLKNTMANIGRLFFGIPASYNYMRYQNLWRILPNAIVFTLFLFTCIVGAINIKKHPPVLVLLFSTMLFYLGATILVSAYQRQLYVVIPIMLVWFGWLTNKTIKFKLSF